MRRLARALARWRTALHLRRAFFTGLILLAPVIATVLILRLLFEAVDGVLQPLVRHLLGRTIPGLGILGMIVLILGVGFLGGNFLGRRLIRLGQDMLLKVPIIRSIYSPAKQLVESFSSDTPTGFKQVVVIEYPRAGAWCVAFLTGMTTDESGRRLALVYIPTAPTPQTGWVAILPAEDVYSTNLSIREALNMSFSGGIVSPAVIKKQALTSEGRGSL